MRRLYHQGSSALWVVAVTVIGCGGAPPSAPSAARVGARGSAIVGGELVERGADPAVVCLYRKPQGDCASATLVAPRIVLAAAHSTAHYAAGELRVLFGDDVGLGGLWRDVVATHECPDADLALIELSEPAPTLPIALSAAELGSDDLGRAARVVGFGATANNTEDEGRKRSGVTRIDALSDDKIVSPSSSWPHKGYVVYFGGDGAKSCFGDSGAPLLVREVDGVERLVGVSSFGTETNCARGLSGAARIDRSRAWLEATLRTLDPRRAELKLCATSASDSDCCARDGHCNTSCDVDLDCNELTLAPNKASAAADDASSTAGCRIAATRAGSPLLPSLALLLGLLALLRLRRWARRRRDTRSCGHPGGAGSCSAPLR